jgi:hypothetical protein
MDPMSTFLKAEIDYSVPEADRHLRLFVLVGVHQVISGFNR